MQEPSESIQARKDNKMKTTEKIVDSTTGEETFIEREETAIETQDRLAVEAKHAAFLLHEQETNQKRQAVLDKLGLTTEEMVALLS